MKHPIAEQMILDRLSQVNWFTEINPRSNKELQLKNYIGETFLIPRKMPNAVRIAFGSKPLVAHRMHYYGTPGIYLRNKFGISD